jgi:uncharacterized protein YdaT
MPFTAKTFKERHNHSMGKAEAEKAASMANAMMKSGVPESEAIATANKRAGAAARKAKSK